MAKLTNLIIVSILIEIGIVLFIGGNSPNQPLLVQMFSNTFNIANLPIFNLGSGSIVQLVGLSVLIVGSAFVKTDTGFYAVIASSFITFMGVAGDLWNQINSAFVPIFPNQAYVFAGILTIAYTIQYFVTMISIIGNRWD